MKKPKTYEQVTGAWIKEKRLEAGMTQEELAEAVGLCSRSHVSIIESGSNMTDQTKYKFFDYFCVIK